MTLCRWKLPYKIECLCNNDKTVDKNNNDDDYDNDTDNGQGWIPLYTELYSTQIGTNKTSQYFNNTVNCTSLHNQLINFVTIRHV